MIAHYELHIYTMAKIELVNINKYLHKSFTVDNPPDPNNLPDGTFIIEKLNLVIPNGRVTAILGPSGCGKTTVLRLVAGLEKPDAGRVLYHGKDVTDVPPGQRKIGIVFQNYALYPQYTSKQNILSYFSFRSKTPELDKLAREKYQRTSELMGVDINHLLNRKPDNLSSGEQQRVAIARCITRDPEVFLMDEPFANLDQTLREKYRVQLKRLLREFFVTTIYVTHDQHEALSLSEQIVIMNEGRIEQIGSPQGVYHYPANLFVADFLSFDTNIPTALNQIPGQLLSQQLADKVVGIRPEDVHIHTQAVENSLEGLVVDIQPLPMRKALIVGVNLNNINQKIWATFPIESGLQELDPVWLRFEKYHTFNKQHGKAIEHNATENLTS